MRRPKAATWRGYGERLREREKERKKLGEIERET